MTLRYGAIWVVVFSCFAGLASAQVTDRRITGMVLWVYEDGSFYVADVTELPLGEAAAQGHRVHQFLWDGASSAAVAEYLVGRMVTCAIVHQIEELSYISVDCIRGGPMEIRAANGVDVVRRVCRSAPDAECGFAGNFMASYLPDFSLACSDIDYENRRNFNQGVFGVAIDPSDPNRQYDRVCERYQRG